MWQITSFHRIVITSISILLIVVIVTSVYSVGIEDRIIFITERFSSSDLFLVDGLKGKPVQLTHNLDVRHPSLSPDGEQVMFISNVNPFGSSILRMVIESRHIEELITARMDVWYHYLDWSPDGSRIVFTIDIRDAGDESEETNICVMDIQSLRIRQITDSPTVKSFTAWSPDGRQILYMENDPESHNSYIFLTDENGNNVNKIEIPGVFIYRAGWFPSGQKISFTASEEIPNPYQLYAMALPEKRITNLTSNGDHKMLSAWSPDGSKILFVTQPIDDNALLAGDIYVMDSDGRNITNLTNTQEAWERGASWSPDGDFIIFDALNDNGGETIFVMDSKGQNRRQLTFGHNMDIMPAWSPDGFKIAFMSNRAGGRTAFRIYTTDIEGQNIEQLTHHQRETDYAPAWSPNGQFIAFVSGSVGDLGIYLIDAKGNNERLIVRSESIFPCRLAWSPDGRYLAYVEYGQDEEHKLILMSISINGGPPTKLSTDELANWVSPAWSPDGKHLLFSATRLPESHPPGMFAADIGSSQYHTLISDLMYDRNAWVWSPDASMILLAGRNNDSKPYSLYLIDPAMGSITLWVEDGRDPDWVRPGYTYAVKPYNKLLTTWGEIKNIRIY
jgi:Tol biopolymer transport system component